MAAVTFDTLKCARRLIDAGMPTQQAEAQAEVMAEAFVFNVDNLVTKDYLDARLTGLEDRLEQKLEQKFEPRFAGLERHFAGLERRLAGLEQRLAVIESRFRYHEWLLGMILLFTVIPVLQSWFG